MQRSAPLYIDLHCHLDLYPNPQEVIQGCLERKIRVLSVTTTPLAWEQTKALAPPSDLFLTALGLHPELAQKFKGSITLFERLLPRAKVVGEVGLDGSKRLSHTWHDQLHVFRKILEACEKQEGRILSVHSRGATSAVLDELASMPGAGVPVLHWFSGTKQELSFAIKLGSWFSVGTGMLLSSKGRSLVSHMPQTRVITETDGPFVKVGNRPSLPWDVGLAIDMLSKLWEVHRDQAREIVSANANTLLRQASIIG